MSIGARSDHYLEMKVKTAMPEELVGMLYEGAIRFMKQAINGISEQDLHSTNISITKAQNIINELNITLDRSKGGDIAGNLSKIYDYVSEQLVEANIKKNPELLNECISLVSTLNSAWSEVIKNARGASKVAARL